MGGDRGDTTSRIHWSLTHGTQRPRTTATAAADDGQSTSAGKLPGGQITREEEGFRKGAHKDAVDVLGKLRGRRIRLESELAQRCSWRRGQVDGRRPLWYGDDWRCEEKM